jgi:hypothetical protein
MLISFSFRYPFIISRIAAFCGLSFLLAIIIPPDCVVLSYISLEVYTNFGIVPNDNKNLLIEQFFISFYIFFPYSFSVFLVCVLIFFSIFVMECLKLIHKQRVSREFPSADASI